MAQGVVHHLLGLGGRDRVAAIPESAGGVLVTREPYDRATYLPWHKLVELNRFGRYVLDAFGHRPYLVGSALVRADYRDVDVRLILPDDEFAQRFGAITNPRYENACWNAHCVAWTHFGQSLTGLVVDFQIDQETQANEQHHGRRHPLGLGGWGPG